MLVPASPLRSKVCSFHSKDFLSANPLYLKRFISILCNGLNSVIIWDDETNTTSVPSFHHS
ncbi:hypothetical protein DJ90_6445 [Paenibacillus macerans]|uniref:Uncharacterized protein n=1 Tax=Paenibacillus macerans TaxID=44252 RepID=A0A090ZM59_PAEMA|nr:hypothetical protein DJ90_6445 [Paenibacillus macerans]